MYLSKFIFLALLVSASTALGYGRYEVDGMCTSTIINNTNSTVEDNSTNTLVPAQSQKAIPVSCSIIKQHKATLANPNAIVNGFVFSVSYDAVGNEVIMISKSSLPGRVAGCTSCNGKNNHMGFWKICVSCN